MAVSLLAPLALAIAFSASRMVGAVSRVPSDSDYQRAQAIMTESGYRPARDGWVALPAWSLRAWRALGDWTPVSGDAISDQPLHRYDRLFVVLEPDGERAFEAVSQKLGSPSRRTRAGRLEVVEFPVRGKKVSFDFRERIAEADIRIVSFGQPSPDVLCDLGMPRGKRCRGVGDWQYVARSWQLVSENSDDVLWAHPPAAGQSLRVSYSNVTLGDALVVRAGHTRDAAERARGTVRMRVLIDDRERAVVTRSPAFDFRSEEISTSDVAGDRHKLTFAIETDSAAANHFCFDAYAIGRESLP